MSIVRMFVRSFAVTLALVALTIGPGLGLRGQPPTSASAIRPVETGDNYFSPLNITIDAGDTVVWTNIGGDSHTITAADGSWGIDDIEPGATYSYTFTQPGVYDYVCLIHINHHNGTITVR